MRKIALDLGSKSCGFAITDEKVTIASAIENFIFPKHDFNQAINRLKYWIDFYENSIDLIVLGYPTNTDDTKNDRTYMVEAFYENLITKIDIKVVLFDERYSTKTATEELMNLGLKASQRKKIKDKMAARVILENFMIKEGY